MSLLLLVCLLADPPKPPLGKDGKPDYEAGLNDVLGKGITPEKNANVLLWQAFGPTPEGANMPPEYFRRLGIAEPPEKGDYLIGLNQFARDKLKLDVDDSTPFYDEQSQASKRPWTAKEFPRIAAWLAANEKPLAVVSEAVKRPDYYNPLVSRKTGNESGLLIGALLPSVQKCREFAALLSASAMLRVGEGKPDAAWADLLDCHRLARHVSRGGTLIELLVGIAIDAIASNATLAYIDRADLTAAQLRARLKEHQALPRLAATADKIDTGERHLFLDSLRAVSSGRMDMLSDGPGGKKLTPEQQKAWAAFDWTPAIVSANRWYDRMVASARLPTRDERVKAFGGVEIDVKALKKNVTGFDAALRFLGQDREKEIVKSVSDILIGLLLPAVSKVMDAEDRAEQIQRNLHVAFALAIHRKDTGKYPPSLDALAPKFIAAVPGDLFTGKPLVYRLEGAGYLFYSFGVNGKDDGGRWFDDDPRGDDPRVRMPIPPPKQP